MDEKLEWSKLEYEEKKHSNDWFWALGIVVIAVLATSIIYKNYFFAAFILLGGILLGFFASKKPDMIEYELNEKGLKIKDHIYPYEKIKAFYVQIDKKPALFIKSERAIVPIIQMPIEIEMANKIKNIFISKNIPEEEMREHFSERVMESLGF